MILLLDLGNSRIKWAIADEKGGVITRSGAIGHFGKPLTAALQTILADVETPARIVVASVLGDPAQSIIQSAVYVRYRLQAEFATSSAEACGVKSGYREPALLGVDRFLAMIAAHHHHPGGSIVIDCGTAVTIDALSADGAHLGGLITPGLSVLQSSLVKRTAGIADPKSAEAVLFGRATGEGLSSGCLRLLVGGIEGIVAYMVSALKSRYKCVLCGGDAVQLAPMFKFEPVVDSDLVLKGLAIWAKQ